MTKLLEPNFTKRLGVNGGKEIKDHPFFEGYKDVF